MSSISHLNRNLRAYCREGCLKESLNILFTHPNLSVDSSEYINLLRLCIAKNALSEGRQIHDHINGREFQFAAHTVLQNTLINMYDKCGSLVDARSVFDHMTEQNVYSWNMIIAAYRRHGFPQQALALFRRMQRTVVKPDQFTMSGILPVCVDVASLAHGLQIHGRIIRCGFQSDVTVTNSLLDMYAKCRNLYKARQVFDNMRNANVVSWNAMITGYAQSGDVDEALTLFEEMPEVNVVSWNAIIVGCAQNGLIDKALEFFNQMQSTGAKPNSATFASILPACAKMGALEQGMYLHEAVRRSEYLTDIVVVTALIDMYAKCGSIHKAREMFDKMPQQDYTSWNAMIVGYAQNGLVGNAFEIFKHMQLAGVKLDSSAFSGILPACARLGSLNHGMEIHRKIIESGCRSDVIMTALIDMYAKCGNIHKARCLFDKTLQRDVASFNAMIVGYVQNGLTNKALDILKEMHFAGLKPDSLTFASILPACAKLEALKQGMEIHQIIIKNRFLSDVVVTTALIDMYAKCGNMWKARTLFEKMPQRDAVSWNAMIVGYSQNDLFDKVFQIFMQMQLQNVKPDSSTFASILPACAKLEALEKGMEIHRKIIESGVSSDVVVTALIDMYAKCGSIHKARGLFDQIHHPRVVSWNAMIAGYAMHGYSKDALKLFDLMKDSGTSPDYISFICVLFACSHAGLVDEGCRYFNYLGNSYFILLKMDHYACIVDLLGRAGYLDEALNFVIKMPVKPNVIVWGSLLGACRSHKNTGLGEFVATLLFELDPKHSAPYVLLSNIYAEIGRWGDIQEVRNLMKGRGIKKTPGCSWIVVDKMEHAFCVGDK